jgi:FMN reductase [NAD(P)H]
VDAEARQPLRRLLSDVDAVDRGSAWAVAHECDELLDAVRFALEHRLDGPVAPVRDRAGHATLTRPLGDCEAEPHALHAAVGDDTPTDHATYSRAVEFRELLRRRRMVRAYEPEPIPRETLERIAGTIRRAPSAGFSQGQRLIVVTDPDMRRRIASLGGEHYYVDQGFPPWISGAGALIVVCTREDDYHDRYRQPDKVDEEGTEIEWPVPYWYVDAGKAAMLLLLAAVDEGLGAGVFGVPAAAIDELRETLGLPSDVAFVEIVTLGKAAPNDPSDRSSSRGTRPRKPLGELVRWERWE